MSADAIALQVKGVADALLDQLERAVIGKRPILQLAVAAIFADGHLLFEDVPGTAKTLLAKSLARTIGGTFRRLQCTPDLLPTDVTGASVFNQRTGDFEFRPGPVFTNVLLADEINRATPRSQAALLECMAERQVTVDGATFTFPRPFVVLATQNPVEHEGTFPLPEAQLDRFLVRLTLGHPAAEAEDEMLRRDEREDPLDRVQQVLTPDQLVQVQQAVQTITVADEVRSYLVRLVGATRSSEEIVLGASPRATKGLYRLAQAFAAVQGRGFVLPDDFKRLVPATLNHRIVIGAEARLSGRTVGAAVQDAMKLVPAPISRAGGTIPLAAPPSG